MKKITIIVLLISALIIGCSDQYPSLEKGLYANLQTSKGDIVLQLEMEKKIRSSLLADLFKICDKKMDLAKNILNSLVEMVRNQSEAKVSS